jgi:hypothetical protein
MEIGSDETLSSSRASSQTACAARRAGSKAQLRLHTQAPTKAQLPLRHRPQRRTQRQSTAQRPRQSHTAALFRPTTPSLP